MNEILKEIRQYIENNFYKNEENVRFSLVSRILQELDWDIWNPKEVATEFQVVPNEDSTRVDIALFDNPHTPTVYIETKAIGKLDMDLAKYEIQLRDYNRNNTAPFSIITDGQKWRFYYSQTGGEFSQKCFRDIDLLNDDIDSVELTLFAFLSKEELRSGRAKKEAETYLQLSQKQRAMEDAYPKARKSVLEPPYPSLPEALIKIVKGEMFDVSLDEASRFIKKQSTKKQTTEQIIVVKPIKPTIVKRTRSATKRDFSNTSISSFSFINTTYEVRFYKDIIFKLCNAILKEHKYEFDRVLSLVGRKRPYFTRNKILLRKFKQIEQTNIFVETNLSSTSIVKLCYNIVSLFGYSKTDLIIVPD